MKDLIIKNYKKTLVFFGVSLFWLCVWQALSMITGSDLLFPGPLKVFKSLISYLVDISFLAAIANSIFDILIGCMIGIVIALFSGLLSNRFSIAKAIVSPMISLVRASPVVSFIVLVYVFVRRMKLSVDFVGIIIVALMVIPVMWTSIVSAYENVDKKLIEVGKTYGFGFVKRFRYIYLPSSKPYILSALSNSVGLAFKAGVAAEIIYSSSGSSPKTIGAYLNNFKASLETESVFALTLIVAIISIIIEKSFGLVCKKRREKAK